MPQRSRLKEDSEFSIQEKRLQPLGESLSKSGSIIEIDCDTDSEGSVFSSVLNSVVLRESASLSLSSGIYMGEGVILAHE